MENAPGVEKSSEKAAPEGGAVLVGVGTDVVVEVLLDVVEVVEGGCVVVEEGAAVVDGGSVSGVVGGSVFGTSSVVDVDELDEVEVAGMVVDGRTSTPAMWIKQSVDPSVSGGSHSPVTGRPDD